MERYALLRHIQQQRQLVRRVIPDQQLGAYVAQHRLLPATIGALPEPSTPVAQPWHASSDQHARMVRPVEGPPFVPATIQPEGESAPVQETRQSTDDSAPTSFTSPIQNANGLEANESIMAQNEGNEVREDPRQPEKPEAEFIQPTPELDKPVLPKIHATEQSDATRQKQEQPAQLRELANTRRSRIEERPQSASRTDSPQPLNTQSEMRRQTEFACPIKQVAPKTVEQNQAEREAAELFTSNTTERTPQEWFAFLTQTGRKQQPNTDAQTASRPSSELRAPQLINELQPAFIAQTQMRQPTSVSQPIVSPENEQQPIASNADTSARVASLSAAQVDGQSTHQFVPARLSNNEQNRENTGKTATGDQNRAGTDVQSETDVEPTSLRAREVLKPLVGFDPAEVRLHRGPAAARFASAQQADAVTVGDDIYLAAEQTNDGPETLGLLAHELTHVARHHEPRAIPPVLNVPAPTGQASATVQAAGISTTSDETFATTDEEALAEQVEQQVTRQVNDARTMDERTNGLTSATPAFAAPYEQMDQHPLAAQEQYSWGKLPAPWEPLPDWLAVSPATPVDDHETFTNPTQPWGTQPMSFERHSNQQHGAGTPATPAGTGSAHSASAGNAQNAAPAAQRAGKERKHATNEAQPYWQEPPMQQHEPEPDLDKLARQVYAVLKRKLGVERRRMS